MPSPDAARERKAASVELRDAATKVARRFPDGHAKLFILRHIGEAIEKLEGGSETAVCRNCGRYFVYAGQFYTSAGLHTPRSCFACRILRREADRRRAGDEERPQIAEQAR